jgi:aryl-alcohol dehydrogenase-like predicted oxidoreductase
MDIVTLGRSGLRVSRVGLGCNNFGGRASREATQAVIAKALDLGVTLFDTADAYGGNGASETLIGEFLGARRNEVVLATKFGWTVSPDRPNPGASRRYVMEAVEASLKRLRTDWIDLYQLHRPDPATPIEETLRALDDLVRQGKVRYLGCSNLAAWQVADALWTSRACNLNAFVSVQEEYNLLARGFEREMAPMATAKGLGLLPYYPLAGGLLTGKYAKGAPIPQGTRMQTTPVMAERYLTDARWAQAAKVEAFAAARGVTPVEVAFGWLAAKPVVASIIAGATRPEQVEANVKAAAWTPTAADMAELDAIAPA